MDFDTTMFVLRMIVRVAWAFVYIFIGYLITMSAARGDYRTERTLRNHPITAAATVVLAPAACVGILALLSIGLAFYPIGRLVSHRLRQRKIEEVRGMGSDPSVN